MLGPGITDRTKFQWIRLIGQENLLPPVGKNAPIVVEKEHIVRSFRKSQEKQRTTEDLANIMLLSYLSWIQEPEQMRIAGSIAELIHARVMTAISTHWKRNWTPEKHKCPFYGIINLFRMIRGTSQFDLLPPLNGRAEHNPKKRSEAGIVDNWTHDVFGDNLKMDAASAILEWDFFHQRDPLEILIRKDNDEIHGT